jgi:hypothetical protein
MSYESRIREQVDEFVASLKREFPGVFEWVDALDSESSIGLDHLDDYENSEEMFNQNPLEVSAGLSTDGMTHEDIDATDSDIRAFAERTGVSVEITEGSADFSVYTFYLHGSFLDVPQ